MSKRIRHALRFALATLVTVYAVGVLWEVLDAYVFGDVAEGLTAAGTVAFNEGVWRVLAPIEALVVFLLRLGDIEPEPPSWPFAFAAAAWLGLASAACGSAIEERRIGRAVAIAITTVVVWMVAHRRLSGWPRARAARAGAERAEQDLR